MWKWEEIQKLLWQKPVKLIKIEVEKILFLFLSFIEKMDNNMIQLVQKS